MSDSLSHTAGGFLPPRAVQPILSPAPSYASNLSSTGSGALPHPRTNPLRAGSAKEEAARRYVEGRLLGISRRYTKKFQPVEDQDGVGGGTAVGGYTNMKQVSVDLSEVVDVLWLSGTPSLQIPYLLNVALSLSTYLPAFAPSPAPTFGLLRKLDHCFASLLRGADIDTGEALPGFLSGRGGMSRTEMVRCRSLVEGTRVSIVEVMSREPEEEEETEGGETSDDDDHTGETEGEMDVDADTNGVANRYGGTGNRYGEDEEDEEHNMDVARVYEKTIVALNESLGNQTAYDAGGS